MTGLVIIILGILVLFCYSYYFGVLFYYIGKFLGFLGLPLNIISTYVYPVGAGVYTFYYFAIIFIVSMFIFTLTSKAVKSHG